VGNIKKTAQEKEQKKAYVRFEFNERVYLNLKKALAEAEKSLANKS
jgi:hypothetical protein